MWQYREEGSGRPLLLLHGIGMSSQAWKAVMPYLSATRRVIAFDIAGFGQTPPLPDRLPPTVANLVDGLEQSISELGLEVPIDMAGNSLGGCLALEAAARGVARSVVAISPACLWRRHPPRHVKYVFGSLRFMARNFGNAAKAAMHVGLLRELLLAVPISTDCRRMPAGDAVDTIWDLAASTAFEATFVNTREPFSGRDITAPITVACGSRDWILPRRSWFPDALPSHARWVPKHGWGHVPMWTDPLGVSELILEGTQRSLQTAYVGASDEIRYVPGVSIVA